MRYKCIIFDCDGVLVDSEELSVKVLVEMANEIGIEISMRYGFDNFPGKSLNSILQFFEQKKKGPLPAEFEIDFRKRSFDLFKTDLKPIKGIHDLLNRITVPFCVASSGPLEKIRLNLTTTKLIDHFENKMFSCYEIGKWKPDPAIFLYAAKKMGFKPSECAVIEDTLVGVKAAVLGGFDVYGFAREKNKIEMEAEGASVFFEMDKLYSMLV
ncbi:MAG: HAD family hydrolase [Bacteroidota bacterium]